ncbi:hypothetical protein OHB05_41615 [Streptomyces sp. NBC_00638]|uniref:hypothetical protein n=1 Tax=Streptomyces sp. NBC_00638 TaxID=2975794 RepID=UPI002250AADE|nr:hypothetical protein [Streptomyces sp. NBC_00638]MCX5009019.1 hypothetical protein [Streptomyces sp. NBC_00638]
MSTACVGNILVVILPARLTTAAPSDEWLPGPLPVHYDGLRAHLEMRNSHFLPAVSRLLYGTSEAPRRWHRLAPRSAPDAPLLAVELQLADTGGDERSAHVILHLRIDDTEVLDVVRYVAGRPKAPQWELPGTELFGPSVAITWPGHASYPFVHLKTWEAPYTLALVTPQHAPLPHVYPSEAGVPWDPADQWLFTLASRTALVDYPPHPESHQQLMAHAMNHSASWRNLILNQGAAFVGLRTGNSFHSVCELYVRGLYLDTLLFGILQNDRLERMARKVSDSLSSRNLAVQLGALESDLAVFRGTHWKQEISSDSRTNSILQTFQQQHRMTTRYEQAVTEISELNRLVQTQESRQIGAALGILTILGLPLGTAFSILDVLELHSLRSLMFALASTALLSGLMLLTPYGRTALRSLRAILPSNGHRP